jgi:hypothetical protein
MAGEAGRGRARASPTKPCRVCHLPSGERDLVEGGHRSGWSPRRLSARFGTISRRDVIGHMTKCVNEQEEKDKECER